MKTKWIMAGCAMCFVLWACEKKLIDLDVVSDLVITTGAFDTDSLWVTSEIFELGEGVVEYGHIWGSTNNLTYTLNEGIDSTVQEMLVVDTFISRIQGVSAGATFFYRAYAKDRLNCLHYGEIVEEVFPDNACTVEAKLTIDNNNCFATCAITLRGSDSVNASKYIWEINGQQSLPTNSADTMVSFASAGSYLVKLFAIDGSCQHSIQRTVVIEGAAFDTTYAAHSVGEKVIVTSSGYTIVGNTKVGTKSSIFMIQLDKKGNILPQFTQTTSLVHSDNDIAQDAFQVGNKNYVIVGSTDVTTVTTPNSNKDFYYVLTNEQGNPLIPPEAIHASNGADIPYGVMEDVDDRGQVVVVGTSNNQSIFVVKTRPDRNSEDYSKPVSTTSTTDSGLDIVALGGTNGYVIVGASQLTNGGSFIGAFTRIKSNGSLHSASYPKTYPVYGSVSQFEAIYRKGNELYVTGQSFAGDASGNVAVLKTDFDGIRSTTSFDAEYGDSGEAEIGNDILVLSDGSVVIVGSQSGQALLMKIKPDGSLAWPMRTFGSAGAPDFFNSVALADDDGFIATGSKNGILYVVKTNSKGEVKP